MKEYDRANKRYKGSLNYAECNWSWSKLHKIFIPLTLINLKWFKNFIDHSKSRFSSIRQLEHQIDNFMSSIANRLQKHSMYNIVHHTNKLKQFYQDPKCLK